MTTVEADGVPIVLIDALILAAVGIPEMLLGLREHPTAAPFQAKQRPKCRHLCLSLAP